MEPYLYAAPIAAPSQVWTDSWARSLSRDTALGRYSALLRFNSGEPSLVDTPCPLKEWGEVA